MSGNDTWKMLEMNHETGAKDTSQYFFKCIHARTECIDYQIHRVVSFGNSELFSLLKGNARFHFYSSFHSCTKGFKKVSISMMLDEQA